ncbi:hypothetical protein [Lysobacter sp. H23M47]|uniref:hypothetical protein n=1 Tax=Lysobacter sp. H23M47 TaxID=2781024 RepID=UPI00187EDF84|nr:hypothetical protein [Lysobacter sp. H23M47]QOW25253.1 hypothetical protein INQ43_04210 [Lysobacter sp. H23M47]
MTPRSIFVATSLALVVGLAACSAPATPEQLPFFEPGVEFTVNQVGTGCTADGAYRAKVSWEVPPSMSSKIEVQVGDDRAGIFARSNDSIGSEETGDWVRDGTLFVMVDRDSKMVLAALKAGPGNCTAPAMETVGD